jgi:hypothetical protein
MSPAVPDRQTRDQAHRPATSLDAIIAKYWNDSAARAINGTVRIGEGPAARGGWGGDRRSRVQPA